MFNYQDLLDLQYHMGCRKLANKLGGKVLGSTRSVGFSMIL